MSDAAHARAADRDRTNAGRDRPLGIVTIPMAPTTIASKSHVTQASEQLVDFRFQIDLDELGDLYSAHLIQFGSQIALGSLGKMDRFGVNLLQGVAPF